MAKKKTDKDKAVDVAKEIAKLKVGYVCEKCFRSKEEGWQMHGAHVMPVGYAATAADPDNILCLCAKCHSMGRESAHENPIQFGLWFEERWPGRYQELWDKAQPVCRGTDWVEVRKELKEQLKALKLAN